MPVSGQYLICAIAIVAQPYAMIAYGIVRRRRGDSPSQRSTAETIVGSTVLAAIVPVTYVAFLTVSMGEPLLLTVCIGFAAFDLLTAAFLLRLTPVAFVAPTVLTLWAAINLLFGLRVGNPLFILPFIAFSALALRSITRTFKRRGETKAT